MAKTKQVFISHDHADAAFAHRLADDLQRLGVPIWIAPESILAGESWVSAIERGLAESDHMVVVLTPAALQSEWVKKETEVAIAQERRRRMRLIPLDVELCDVPLLLSSYQMVSFRRDYDRGLSRLAARLGFRVTLPEPAHPAPDASVDLVEPELARPPIAGPEPHSGPRPASPVIMDRLRGFEPEMILIPAGEFLMGSDPKKDRYAQEGEQPQHTLYLPDYYLAKTPVTNTHYAAFVQATDHRKPETWKRGIPPSDKGDHPVGYVSWRDAVAYCRWLSETTGKTYTVPSAAEWEKGARGSDGRIYPWGSAWDLERCNSEEGGKRDTTPVGAYPDGVSPYGLLDMAGNVWEWTRSLYGSYPYVPDDGREDLQAGEDRVLRGGPFPYGSRILRSACRFMLNPNLWLREAGFRVIVVTGCPSLSGNADL